MELEVVGEVIKLRLSRKNIQTLLDKLNGTPPNSARTIFRSTKGWKVFVTAEENGEHYMDRTPGVMHPANESAARLWKEGKGRD